MTDPLAGLGSAGSLGHDTAQNHQRRAWLDRNRRQNLRGLYWCTWCGMETKDDQQIWSPDLVSLPRVPPVLCTTCGASMQPGARPSACAFWAKGGKLRPEPDDAQLDEVAHVWAEGHDLKKKPYFPIPGHKDPVVRGREIAPKTWISIELVEQLDPNDPAAKKLIDAGKKPERPAAGRFYVVKSNKREESGYLDGLGRARVNGIEPGNYEISFPRVDPKRWKRG
jgi:hypothetical protein